MSHRSFLSNLPWILGASVIGAGLSTLMVYIGQHWAGPMPWLAVIYLGVATAVCMIGALVALGRLILYAGDGRRNAHAGYWFLGLTALFGISALVIGLVMTS